ncbi:NAD-dependent epimerase/dehydratase family protein [Nakamurella aerolata]|uniref:NAD-dependent epimerase/dehydratase family protein n=1 Tax=Nakamurella aerolata TaxID=1656892 RepID=A0A849AEJ2_9ACTN|nr:NAD-dependent epimerase/dehydratase family protein [Nakamurella aerolata]NNG36880.1 NAD-dependent epimerase/dehydratase family protein [Nakamurella aerolata]
MNTPALHVVTGAGPVGSTVANQLAAAGLRVRVLTRSGGGPDHPLIERRRVDVSDPVALAGMFEGAAAVYHCIHGSKYRADTWRAELPRAEQVVMDAAGKVGAVVAFPESLYAYGPVTGPITQDTPLAATTGKLGIRAELLRAREQHSTPTVSVAASDFFGPLVRSAHAGERMIPAVLVGKTMRVVGSLDAPHSWTYVPDLAAAMIRAAVDQALWNTLLHAPTGPALTQRQLIEAVARAGNVAVPKMSTIPLWALRAAGVFSTDSRELAETGYQFARPFVLDSTRSERRLGLVPAPLQQALAATVDWWRGQLAEQPAA